MKMKLHLIFFFLLFAVWFSAQQPDNNYRSLIKDSNGNLQVIKGKTSTALAWAFHTEEIESTGWNRLYLTTNNALSDEDQLYYAGFLEGAISTTRISQNYGNVYPHGFSQKVLQWFQTNLDWSLSQAKANSPSDPYWKQVYLVLQQLQGMYDGYSKYRNASTDLNLNFLNFYLLSADGDVGDVQALFGEPSAKPTFESHCSSLVKLTTDLQELYVGHTTWAGYSTMLRTYKIYNISLSSSAAASKMVSFSSYPGFLVSTDDFYLTDAGLWIAETTNDILNASLYSKVVPQSLLSWIRTIVANRMATNGKDWTNIFAKYNSGTYNNQWIVVDYKLFTPGQALKPGTLWILEQIPGFCQIEDKTDFLNQNQYWPSYNVPYFSYIYNISGYLAYYEKYGDLYSYSKTPRAQIFTRDHSNVKDLSSMQWILRYNNWRYDPLSLGSPALAISSRYDLITNSTNVFLQAGASGGIDTKITNFRLFKEFSAVAISGPTYYEQPAFQWKDWPNIAHAGQPEVFNFGWFDFGPERN